jgi:uncharacterized protein YbaR (Trm112 family)
LTSAVEARAREFDRSLLEILACPECLGELAYEDWYLHCCACDSRYPVRDGGVPALHTQAREDTVR